MQFTSLSFSLCLNFPSSFFFFDQRQKIKRRRGVCVCVTVCVCMCSERDEEKNEKKGAGFEKIKKGRKMHTHAHVKERSDIRIRTRPKIIVCSHKEWIICSLWTPSISGLMYHLEAVWVFGPDHRLVEPSRELCVCVMSQVQYNLIALYKVNHSLSLSFSPLHS